MNEENEFGSLEYNQSEGVLNYLQNFSNTNDNHIDNQDNYSQNKQQKSNQKYIKQQSDQEDVYDENQQSNLEVNQDKSENESSQEENHIKINQYSRYQRDQKKNNLNNNELRINGHQEYSKEYESKNDIQKKMNQNIQLKQEENNKQKLDPKMKKNIQEHFIKQNEQNNRIYSALQQITNNQESNYMKKGNQKEENSESDDCQFCGWKITRIKFLRDNMHIKYFDQFNFYFSKPINEILANYNLPHVIALKDFQYFDDENEYLKRYYRVDEVPPRLAVLANFFTTSYKQTRPNLIVINQYKAIQKRNTKQDRLFMRQVVKNVYNGIDYNTNNNLYHRDDSSESEAYSSEKYQESNNQGSDSKSNKKKNLPSRVLHSHLTQSPPLSQNQISESSNQSLSNYPYEYDNYRNFILQMSFETSTHDIYYPSFSTSNKESENQSNQSHKLSTNAQIQIKDLNVEQLNFKKGEKHKQIKDQNYYQDQFNNYDDGQIGSEIRNQDIDIDDEYIPTGIPTNFEKKEFYEKNKNQQNQKVNPFVSDDQEAERYNNRLMDLIVLNDKKNLSEDGQSLIQYLINQQNQDKNQKQLIDMNQLIEQMQAQQNINYLNLLDIESYLPNNENDGLLNLFSTNNSNNNYANYDPSKRVNTLISQSNSALTSNFNTINSNNYIIGSNNLKKQNHNIPIQEQETLQNEQQQISDLNFGNSLKNMVSLMTERKSSGISNQQILTNREGIDIIDLQSQNDHKIYEQNQQPLKIFDLLSRHNQLQSQKVNQYSKERLIKEDLGQMKSEQNNTINNSQKSMKVVQQYILSQLKKQYDCLHNGNNQKGINSVSTSQHKIQASPDQKDHRETSSNKKKSQQKVNRNQINSKEHDKQKGKHAKQKFNENSVINNSRKQLTERNFTEVNLGSTFDKLLQPNRLASQENKPKIITNESNKLDNFNLKKENNIINTDNNQNQKKTKYTTNSRINQVSNSTSPLDYTPRDFTKKKSDQNMNLQTSQKYLITEQSPNQFTYSTKIREQTSGDNEIGGITQKNPQSYLQKNYSAQSKQINTQMTTTMDHSLPDNNSVVTQQLKDTQNIKPLNNTDTNQFNSPNSIRQFNEPNKLMQKITSIRNKIIHVSEQKSSLNSPSRICTDRDTKNPRLKQNKSPSLVAQSVRTKNSESKNIYKRNSNKNTQSPNSFSKKISNSVLNNNYYQRAEDTKIHLKQNQNVNQNTQNHNGGSANLQQNYLNTQSYSNSQQKQLTENSSSNLQTQIQIPQVQSNTISSNPAISHNQQRDQQQSQFNSGSQSLVQAQNITAQSSQKNGNKPFTQKILSNALTNTINKFYKDNKNFQQQNQQEKSPNSNIIQTSKVNQQEIQKNKNQITSFPNLNQHLQQYQLQPQYKQQLQTVQGQQNQHLSQENQISNYQQQSQNVQTINQTENQHSPRLALSQVQIYQKANLKNQEKSIQSKQLGRVKTNPSEEINQKIIKSLCLKRINQKDSIGSQFQMSQNLDLVNSARSPSINKGQEYKIKSQNSNYDNSKQQKENACNSRKKQMLFRQKGSSISNNQETICLNSLFSNQSINTSVNNNNVRNDNFISNINTNNIPEMIYANQFLFDNNSNIKFDNKLQQQLEHQQQQIQSPQYQKQQLIQYQLQQQDQQKQFQYQQSMELKNQQQEQQYQNDFLQSDMYKKQAVLKNQSQNQNQILFDHKENSQKQHVHIKNLKQENTPRQSKPHISIAKTIDKRKIKTEIVQLTDDSQDRNLNQFNNITYQNTQTGNNEQSQINQVQQQRKVVDLKTIKQSQDNSKLVQHGDNNDKSTKQNLSSNTFHQVNNSSNKISTACSTIKKNLSPGKATDEMKKSFNQKEDNKIQSNLKAKEKQGFQLPIQLVTTKKTQIELQHGNGFFTERNINKKSEIQNQNLNNNQQQTIHSSRGSYQGHYADFVSLKNSTANNQFAQGNNIQHNLNEQAVISNSDKKEVKQQQVQSSSSQQNISPFKIHFTNNQQQQQQQQQQNKQTMFQSQREQKNLNVELNQHKDVLLNNQVTKQNQRPQLQ